MEQSFDWLEIMKGEIAQREDDSDSRQDRRQEIAKQAQALFDEVVDPALKQAQERETSLELTDRDPEAEAAAFRRLSVTDKNKAWLEVIAEPYSPVVTLRLKNADGQRLSEPFPLKEVDQELILSWAAKLLR